MAFPQLVKPRSLKQVFELDHSVRISLRLDAAIYTALEKEALAERREVPEHIHRLLAKYVIDQQLLDAKKAAEYQLMWSLVERAVELARKIYRDGGFASDITYRTIQACMADEQWAQDYEKYVGDNPYKHGNPRKTPINQEIGYQIRKSIGASLLRRQTERRPR